MTVLVMLVLQNADAETTSVIQCSRTSVDDILTWYGSHHAGDDYNVTMNGVALEIDENGERVVPTIDLY